MTDPTSAASRRIDLIDVARGVALLAMVVFHFTWDLGITGVIDAEVPRQDGWRWFARAIAASFLFLAGVSLTLAHLRGLRRESFLIRLAMVAGGAALVTAGTWYLFPQSFVTFGILHHIVVASLLALPFVWLPAPVALAVAAVAFALPHFVAGEAFSAPWLVWLGLGESVPRSVDFVPLFPWIGWVLAGVGLGRLARPWLSGLGWRAEGPVTGTVALAGRHSLLFYLAHQAVLLPLAWALAWFVATPSNDALTKFEADCVTACTAAGKSIELCTASCGCVRDAVERDKALAQAMRSDRFDRVQELKLIEISGVCARDPAAKP